MKGDYHHKRDNVAKTTLVVEVSYLLQHAKKVVSNSQGLVDSTIWLVNADLNLPAWQVKFFKEF